MKKYPHILVPTDGSKLSLRAAREGAELASALGAKMSAVYVRAPWMPPMPGEDSVLMSQTPPKAAYDAASTAEANEALSKVSAAAAAESVPCVELIVVNGQPWAGIIEAARSNQCDLIVMASHGRRGLDGILIGSETHKVLTHSKIPVLVCR